MSIGQYVAVALAVNIGKPFRVSFWKNKWFLVALILLTLSNSAFFLVKNPEIMNFMQMEVMPTEFTSFIFIATAINSIVTLFWEWGVVGLISNFIRKRANKMVGH